MGDAGEHTDSGRRCERTGRPSAYADEPGLHWALTHLRANAPVSWVDVDGYRPFWAITKHADIMAVEHANDVFTNSPRPVPMTTEADEIQAGIGISTLIHMDDPQHRLVRAIGGNWFRPKAMRAMKLASTNSPPATSTTWRQWSPNATSSRRSR